MAFVDTGEPVRREGFATENLIVREVRGFLPDRLVITFAPYSDAVRVDEPAFGEEFLRSRGIDAVHVIARGNHWYQYREMPEAAAFVAGIASGYQRVLAFGSSMGGYAAIRFGGACGASTALALSPQFSIDPAVVPFERRWLREVPAIDFTLERSWRVAFAARSYIVFDPLTHDRRHARLFRGRTQTCDIAIPDCGHPAGGYLADLGLLQRAVPALLDGDLDHRALTREARARRKESPIFYAVRSQRARTMRRRVAFARQASALRPDNVVGLSLYGMALAESGDRKAAEAVFARARAIRSDDLFLLRFLMQFYRVVGDREQLAAVARELVAAWPGERDSVDALLARPVGPPRPRGWGLLKLLARRRMAKQAADSAP
jgi:hypothetical protein